MTPSEEITYREGIQRILEEIREDGKETRRQVTFTNGKVRKIVIALVLVFGILIGQNFTTPHDILKLIAGALTP